MNKKESQIPGDYNKRESADFEKDRALIMAKLAEEMAACPLCTDGEESSKALHLCQHTDQKGN